MTWGTMLTEQLDFYVTTHLRPRLAGLTDDEYLWEPAAGAWSLRPGTGGRWELDALPVEPPIPPLTTIAWRLVHVGRDVLGKRARALFAEYSLPAGATVPEDAWMYDDAFWPEPLPTTADDALAFLDQAYGLWRDGLTRLDDAALLRPIGARGGPYADQSVAELALHVNREVMAHGAEICLLRDLYRARAEARDALVAAALRGDAAEVMRLLDGGATPRPSLTAEAAGLRHWEVVRVLAERGADVNTGNPGALHFAAAYGEAGTALALRARGADPTLADPTYRLTPAGWAEFFGHTELAARLRP